MGVVGVKVIIKFLLASKIEDKKIRNKPIIKDN